MVALMEIDFRGRMERRGRGGGIISALMMTHSRLVSHNFTCNPHTKLFQENAHETKIS